MNRYIAIDCEMVGSGNKSLLARVSLVNSSGLCVYDKYVRPNEPITDYRAFVSGIQKHQLATGEDFSKVQREVQNLIKDKILVGHSLHFDFAVLKLSHPEQDIRDISKYEPFRNPHTGQPISLKELAKRHLGIYIQQTDHDSKEDARVAMKIYQTVAKNWP